VLLGRRLTSDVDGKYRDQTGPKPVTRQIPLSPAGHPRYQHYDSDAFWNTFWNINQVWGVAYPDVTRQFVNFLVDMYGDGGLIPRGPCGHDYTWVMIASHSTPLIVGAYMKGIRGFDIESAYEGMRKNAFPGGAMGHGHFEHNSAERGGIEDYIKYGYIPIDGRPLERPWFYHRELVDGGTFELQLGPAACKTWGRRPEQAPPSMSTAGNARRKE